MIIAHVNGFALPGKKASFAVSIKDTAGNSHQRIVPLKCKSMYQAEWSAIKYVMLAISNKDNDVLINTSLPYVPAFFNKKKDGSWAKKSRSKSNAIDEVRKLSTKFRSFDCKCDKDSGEMLEIREMARCPTKFYK